MKVYCILVCLVVAVVADDICTMNYDPKCGNDGKVYVNACHLKNARLGESETFENCRGKNFICPAACSKEYRPVCAQDGKIYPNKCTMQYENCGILMSEMPFEDCQV